MRAARIKYPKFNSRIPELDLHEFIIRELHLKNNSDLSVNRSMVFKTTNEAYLCVVNG